MYDVAIVGAGPAGSTVARLLSERYRVLLVDRRMLDADPGPGMLVKPCGGLLSPSAQRELARQGLGVAPSVVAGPQLFAVRAVDLSARIDRLYQRFYVNVDREAFDRWLVSLVPARVDRCFGWSLETLAADEDAPLLTFRTAEGGRASARARLVIGADGANSSVRRLAYSGEPRPERYTAIQAVFDVTHPDPFYGAVFDEHATDFYGWTIPKGGVLYVGGAFPAGPGVSARFDALVSRMREAGFRFGAELSRGAATISRPTRPSHLFAGVDQTLLVGEAAGFISPSSGEGISYALRSAAYLAEATASELDGVGHRYAMAAMPLALKVGVKAVKGRVIYGPHARRLVMRSRLGTLPLGRVTRPAGALGGSAR
jgi:flavin-dependent dehydrogenase